MNPAMDAAKVRTRERVELHFSSDQLQAEVIKKLVDLQYSSPLPQGEQRLHLVLHGQVQSEQLHINPEVVVGGECHHLRRPRKSHFLLFPRLNTLVIAHCRGTSYCMTIYFPKGHAFSRHLSP